MPSCFAASTRLTRNNLIVIRDQHGVGKAKARDAVGNLFDLAFGMAACIPRIGAERRNGF